MLNRISKIVTIQDTEIVTIIKCSDCNKWIPEKDVLIEKGWFKEELCRFAICQTCNHNYR